MLTNQQALLIVDSASLIETGRMRPDGADIRVSSRNDNRPIHYWVEPNTINTDTTRLWINADALPSNETTSLFLYYGNTNASSESNVSNTFIAVFNGNQPLVGNWAFDESIGISVEDTSGYGNHGILLNGPPRTNGYYQSAVLFKETNQYVNIASSESLNITNGITLEGWIHATPPPIPVTNGILIHLDASAITGVTDNARITQWNDLSGNAFHAVQTTNAARPYYKTNAINGKPALLFQGAQYLITPLQPKASDLAHGSTLFVLCSPTNNGIAFGAWGDPRFYFGVWSDTLQSGYGTNWARVGVPSYGTPRLFRLQYNGTDSRLYANGVIMHTNPATFVGTNANVMAAGTAYGTNRHFYGLISEIILFRRSLTTNEVEAVEQFLGYKWLGWSARRTASILAKGTNAYRLELNLDNMMIQGGINAQTVTAPVATGRWQHVALTYDRTNQILYLDGLPQTTNILSDMIGVNTSNLISGLRFPGLLDELRLYRRALSASEVALAHTRYSYATTNFPGRTLLAQTCPFGLTTSSGATETWTVPDSMPPARNNHRLKADTALFIPFNHGPGATDQSQYAHPVTEQGIWLSPGRHLLRGGGEQLTAPDDATLDGTSRITLSAWVTPVNLPAIPAGIVSKPGAYTLALEPTGQITFDVAEADTPASSNTSIETNQTYQIVAVFDGSLPENQRLRIYINGILDVTSMSTNCAIPRQTSSGFFIGARQSTDTNTLNAVIGPISVLRRAPGPAWIDQWFHTESLCREGPR